MMPSPSSSFSSSLPWLSLVGCIWLQTINGPNADFPVYSSQLKDLKRLSQVQLNFLAFASDAGKLFGWFAGIAAIYLPLWLVAAIGAAFGLIGYGVQFLFLDSPRLSYWHLFLLTSLAGNGICWINTVCYLLCIRNFQPVSRVVVGLSTSYLGLSAKVYTVVAEAIFHHHHHHPRKDNSVAKDYLLLNAAVPALVALAFAPSLRVVETKGESGTEAAFFAMFAITLATGVCAVTGSIGSASNGLSSGEHTVSLAVLLASPLLVPAAIRCREALIKMRGDKRENRIHVIAMDEAENGEGAMEIEVMKEEEEAGHVGSEEEGSAELGGLDMLRRVDFWLYFFSYMFSATLGLVFLNNLGQIAESRGLGRTPTLVSLSSSFGFFGRLLPAFLDYHSTRNGYTISRTASMAAMMAPMAGGFFLLLSPSTTTLYISTAVIGACTGAITSNAVSATSDLFGARNFGVNHNILVANIPIGSFCFGYLAAFLYQKEADGSRGRCFGSGCYHTTFLIWGSICSIGTLLCTILYARSRNFARKL